MPRVFHTSELVITAVWICFDLVVAKLEFFFARDCAIVFGVAVASRVRRRPKKRDSLDPNWQPMSTVTQSGLLHQVSQLFLLLNLVPLLVGLLSSNFDGVAVALLIFILLPSSSRVGLFRTR